MELSSHPVYHVGRRNKHARRALLTVLVLFGLAVLVVGYIVITQYLKPDTNLRQSQAVTTAVSVNKAAMQTITEPTFSLQLPQNWQPTMTNNSTIKAYGWRGTTLDDSTRSLDAYVDTLPTNMAVNKLLPLKGADDHLSLLDTVSDNCANFTGMQASADGQKLGYMPAKWGGVDFLCDTANTVRNVVGTGSTEGINRVSVVGSKGKHSYFFVYTDNSGSPDYTIFTSAMQSFRAL